MNVLDENIPEPQRHLLRRWRIPVRQIGSGVGRAGMSDEDILPLLHGLHRPTFFTRDADFSDPSLCHQSYCLVWLKVTPLEVAEYVRRLLRHPALNTQAKRMGKLIEVMPSGLIVWRLNKNEPLALSWPKRKRR